METLSTGLRVLIRFIVFIFLVIAFLLTAICIRFLTKENWNRKRRLAANTSFYVRLLVRVFNFKVKFSEHSKMEKAFLYVGNHLGFIDVLALSSIRPFLFVTSVEMKETPFLGLLTELGGCLYVERRSRAKIRSELNEMVEALQNGLRVAIYPEATSHNGERVLPFKRTLISAGALAGAPVVPGVFNYISVNGESFNMRWRDSLCWYGDITFLEAFWRILKLKSVVMSIDFINPIFFSAEDDRAKMASQLHDVISERFIPVSQQLDSEFLRDSKL